MSMVHVNGQNGDIIERVVALGDLDALKPVDRVAYYAKVCGSLGLNPLTRPFEYVKLQGKLTLYARRDCAEQLRKIHSVSVVISARERTDDLYVVTARASMPCGRVDESTGAVSIGGLKGENLANALMKAETKAKRRVTLSICGLGWLDETEVQDVRGAKQVTVTADGEILEPSSDPDLTKQLAASVEDSWPKWVDRHCVAFSSASDLGGLNEAWLDCNDEIKRLQPPKEFRDRVILAKDTAKVGLVDAKRAKEGRET